MIKILMNALIDLFSFIKNKDIKLKIQIDKKKLKFIRKFLKLGSKIYKGLNPIIIIAFNFFK